MIATNEAPKPLRKEFSKAALAVGWVNQIVDREMRIVVAAGLINIAKKGRGAFPNVRPAPSAEIIAGFVRLGILEMRGGEYVCVTDDTSRNALAQLLISREGFLSGVTC
ncbi:MAG: hypothetical protein ACREGR_02000 [Minisyncoccia bacterium]